VQKQGCKEYQGENTSSDEAKVLMAFVIDVDVQRSELKRKIGIVGGDLLQDLFKIYQNILPFEANATSRDTA
jgi:hypothetical protein